MSSRPRLAETVPPHRCMADKRICDGSSTMSKPVYLTKSRYAAGLQCMLRLLLTFASRRTGKRRNRVSPRLGQSPNASHGAVRALFVFEIADLCIAHLSHLHHTLAPAPGGARPDRRIAGADRRRLYAQPGRHGRGDRAGEAAAGDPHALFRAERAAALLARTGDRYPVHFNPSPQVTLTRARLPKSTKSWCCREIDGRLRRRCRGPVGD
jgi:hypothetical protein